LRVIYLRNLIGFLRLVLGPSGENQMEDAASLRRQAERSLRLAKAVSDKQASDALTAHATELLERAAELEAEAAPTRNFKPAPEQQPAAQQQQQIQPKKEGE
jgi:hypothetical protein